MPLPFAAVGVGAAIGAAVVWYNGRSTQEEYIYFERTEIEIEFTPTEEVEEDDPPPRYTPSFYNTPKQSSYQDAPKQRRNFFGRSGSCSSMKYRTSSNDDFSNTSTSRDNVGSSFSPNKIYNLNTEGGHVFLKADGNKRSLKSRLHIGKKGESKKMQGAGEFGGAFVGIAAKAFLPTL